MLSSWLTPVLNRYLWPTPVFCLSRVAPCLRPTPAARRSKVAPEVLEPAPEPESIDWMELAPIAAALVLWIDLWVPIGMITDDTDGDV